MNKTQQSIFTGFVSGLFFLALMFVSHVDNLRMKQISIQTQELEDFKEWAEEICHNGYSTAEFLQTGEYKATCR